MAQFRTTADLVDSILRRAGELTDGTSSFESQALDYLNQVHHSIINGGNEFDVDVDEAWTWAKAKHPIILELQPALETGTVSLTQGSESGSFSSAPAASQQGNFLKIDNRDEYFKIAQHTAGATAFELDAAYTGDTGATLTFKSIQLDYDLVSEYIIIDSTNNKLDFEETASTELTATLTAGTYTPAQLATEINTQLTSAGASAYTITYDSISRKFTLASDRGGGGGTFKLLAATGSNITVSAYPTLGIDYADQADAASHESTYPFCSLVRFIQPMTVYSRNSIEEYSPGNIYGIDELAFKKDFPLSHLKEGVPTRFTVIAEKADGTITVRFNKYPKNLTRVEVEHIPMPLDLQDNAASVPLIPRKFLQVLEYGASFYLLLDKEDSKAQGYASLAAAKLKAMMKQNRKELMRSGKYFGKVVARRDHLSAPRRLIYGEPS